MQFSTGCKRAFTTTTKHLLSWSAKLPHNSMCVWKVSAWNSDKYDVYDQFLRWYSIAGTVLAVIYCKKKLQSYLKRLQSNKTLINDILTVLPWPNKSGKRDALSPFIGFYICQLLSFDLLPNNVRQVKLQNYPPKDPETSVQLSSGCWCAICISNREATSQESRKNFRFKVHNQQLN